MRSVLAAFGVVVLLLVAQPVQADPIHWDYSFRGVMESVVCRPCVGVLITGQFTGDGEYGIFSYRGTPFLLDLPGHTNPPDWFPTVRGDFVFSVIDMWQGLPSGNELGLSFGSYDPVTGVMSHAEGIYNHVSSGNVFRIVSGVAYPAPEPVPEPASLLLLGTGLVGLRAWRTRRL